jgi:ATP/maltotriose-dependent transcriptional regulator MalT/DNA-binding SARP family transcriptional activator
MQVKEPPGSGAGQPAGTTAGRISRPVLAARIAKQLGQGHLLMVAPAGYGKTIALEEGLRELGAPVARVFCTPDAQDPGRLLTELVTSLREPLPGLADSFGRRLRRGTEPLDPKTGLGALLAELQALLVDRLVVVFEDAENIADSPHAVALVGDAIAAAGPQVSIALAARRSLPLRTAKLRATGRLVELGPQDLVFGAAECAEFLRLRHRDDPSPSDVEAVMAATEGWPLGIALMDVSGARMPGARDDGGDLFEYLAEEVFEGLPEPLRGALVALSLTEEVDESRATAMGLEAGELADLERMLGLLIRPVGSEGARRLHPLLRQFLRRRLEESRSAQDLAELHARAAGALTSSGRTTEAVAHWLEAGRWDAAAEAIETAGFALVRTSPQTARGWLERLPDAQRRRPALRLLEGSLEYGAGNHDRAAELQREALGSYRTAGEREMEWATRIALMNTLHASGGFEEAIALAGDVESPEALEAAAAPNLAVMAGMCMSHLGRFDGAARMNESARAHPQAKASLPLALAMEGLFIDRPQGRFDDAVRKSREALAELDRFDPFERGPFVRALLHLVLEEQGLDDEALAESLRAQEDARRIGVEGYLVAMLRLHSVGIHARAGRLEDAQRELDAASHYEHGAGWRQVTVGQATLATRRGDFELAMRHAEDSLSKVSHGPFLQRIHTVASLAPLLVECGRRGRARDAVEATLAAWRPGYFRGRMLSLRGWLRWLEDEEGGIDDLVTGWEESKDQAQHLVRRDWDQLRGPLWRALELGALEPEPVMAAITDAFPGGAKVVPFAAHPVPEVRRAALAPAVRSGHPDAVAALAELRTDVDPAVARAAVRAHEELKREPPPLSFRVLGGFEARRGEWIIDDAAWRRPMAARVVRLLLVRRGEWVPEDVFFDAFWPDKEPGPARRSLQVALSQARAALDVPGAESSAIEASGRSYRLRSDAVEKVDADEFDRAVGVALSAPNVSRRTLERAVELWSGEPLPEERYEDWTLTWRQRLVDLLIALLTRLAERCIDDGDLPGAIDAGRRLTAADPLNESAHRRLMVALSRSGRRAEALRQYLECRRALVDALGVEPEETTTALHARLLAGEPV